MSCSLTEEGTVQKVVQYAAGDTVIIQETRVFQTLEPIKVLRLSSGTVTHLVKNVLSIFFYLTRQASYLQ